MATVNRKVVFLISAAVAIAFVVFVISVIVLKDNDDDKSPEAEPKEKFNGKRLELSKYYDDHDFLIHTGGEKNFFRRFRAAESMQQFMFEYNRTDPHIFRQCSITTPPPEDQVCGVNVNNFSPCDWEHGYGITRSDYISPCIFMRLNADTSFDPLYLNDKKLPADVPEDLKYEIKSYARNNGSNANLIWVSCEGITDEDKKNVGPISYLPQRGFIEYFFPCRSEELCIPPAIALHFVKPKRNVAINVKCTAWADNFKESTNLRLFIEDIEDLKRD